MAEDDNKPAKTEELDQNYPVLHEDMERFEEVTKANLGDMRNLSPFDLQRITIPTGGGNQFTIPNVRGDQTAETITAIIGAWHTCRAFWPGDFSGSEPPQCASEDGIKGRGDPGGDCARCEYAEWGSAEDGEGIACKEMNRLFLALPDSMMPYVLTLPPTSLNNYSSYLVGLGGVQLPYWTVETEIGLEKEQNDDGIEYAVATFQLSTELGGEERERAVAFHDMVLPLAASPEPPDAEDYGGQAESDAGDDEE